MIAASFLFPIFASFAAACVSDIQSHSSVSSCYVLHAGSVYDLTKWVSTGHPGKSAPILPYCGKSDASFDAKYTAQHAAKDFTSSGATLLGSLCPPPSPSPSTPSINAAAGSAAPKPSSSVSITSIAKATASSVAVSVSASNAPATSPQSTQSTPCTKAFPTATATATPVPVTDYEPSMYVPADATSSAAASAATTAASDVYSSGIGSKADWSHLILVSAAAIMAAASI